MRSDMMPGKHTEACFHEFSMQTAEYRQDTGTASQKQHIGWRCENMWDTEHPNIQSATQTQRPIARHGQRGHMETTKHDNNVMQCEDRTAGRDKRSLVRQSFINAQ